MLRVDAEVGVAEERAQRGEAGLEVLFALRRVLAEVTAEADEALGADGGGGAVDRLVVVVDLGVAGAPVAELVKIRRAAVPVGDAVERGVGDVPVAGRLGA